MKIWVIGGGQWGINLVRTLDSLAALGGIVEADLSRRDKLASEFPHATCVSDINRLDPNLVQAVAIATPVPTHFKVAKDCLTRGWHTFVEKPMTQTAAEAETLCALASRQNRVLMVGHLLLYQPAIRWISAFLKENGLGRVFSIHQERLNFGRARSVENALWSLGVHDVAVLLHLAGEPPTNVSFSAQAVVNSQVEDDFHVHSTFPSGMWGHLHVSWLWPERRRRMTVVGEKGFLVFDETDQSVRLHRKQITPDLQHIDSGEELVFQDTAPPLAHEMSHFISCIQSGATPVSDGNNGLQVVRVLETINANEPTGVRS